MTAALLPTGGARSMGDRLEQVGPIAFELPRALSAGEPPEARGLARDAVRLMVSDMDDDSITHARFRDLPDFLDRGDVLVVNASATIDAALDAWRLAPHRPFAERIELHLSSPLPPEGQWVVELRRLTTAGTAPLLDARASEQLVLADGARATLLEPFPNRSRAQAKGDRVRLWVAQLTCPGGVMAFAAQHGWPIRYSYVRERWPLPYYDSVFATEPGSAEMPSAGRPFTRHVVARLEDGGVRIVPVVLHTGVGSLEFDEPPYPERYRVSATTADAVNEARAAGGRVVAVGTTVVRALETVASPGGRVRPGAGWTDVVVTSERGVRTVDALVTGLHAPRSSHLAMLEALAGRRHLAVAYEAAIGERYLWHEFGDMHVMLRSRE